MITKFYIAENKWFVSAYILKGTFPMPDGMTKEFLEEHVKELNDIVKLDMYFYVDDSALPLQVGDKVVMGTFDWRVVNKVFSFNSNTLTYTLSRY